VGEVDIFTTFEGDNTVLMLLLAKGLLTDYAEHFGELNPVGTVTFDAGQAVETVSERLFPRQIVQVVGDGYEPFEVSRAVRDHAVNAARAHMATVLLAAFQSAVQATEDEAVASVLRLLCDLFALHDLEVDRAFFMEHGRLSGQRCKALTREVDRLCNEVRGLAGELVAGFGIPDELLAAPIGLSEAAASSG
jgi:acyl-CoA oxidase